MVYSADNQESGLVTLHPPPENRLVKSCSYSHPVGNPIHNTFHEYIRMLVVEPILILASLIRFLGLFYL